VTAGADPNPFYRARVAEERIAALIRAGDVLATRLDEADFKGPLDRKVLKQRQRAVRAWLAIAHPNGKGHPE
jgi:hypothetical protein